MKRRNKVREKRASWRTALKMGKGPEVAPSILTKIEGFGRKIRLQTKGWKPLEV